MFFSSDSEEDWEYDRPPSIIERIREWLGYPKFPQPPETEVQSYYRKIMFQRASQQSIYPMYIVDKDKILDDNTLFQPDTIVEMAKKEHRQMKEFCERKGFQFGNHEFNQTMLEEEPMANNHLYLKCKICPQKIMLGKYYPAELGHAGWGTRGDDLSARLDQFFDDHEHGEDGTNFGGFQYTLEYEIPQSKAGE